MISKEDFNTLIENLRSKLDETTLALVSEEVLATLSAFNNGYDEYDSMKAEVDKLKNEKEELLKVNGKLYQKIGFDKEEEKEEKEDKKDDIETIDVEDIIDEKGDLI